MPRSLADYDSDRGQYARAEQPWVCGRACEGTPCYIGPDEKGRCQVHLECVPAFRDDRWQCTRPRAAGGKCTEGPLPDGSCPHCPAPCQPKRGLLARRRVLTVFVAAAALGSLFLFAGGESNKEFLSPGKLSVHHHALQQRCTKCHTAEEGHAVVKTVGARNAIDQSFKCLDCHRFGEHALHPHGIAPDRLAAATDRIEKSDFAANRPAWLALASWGPGIPKDEDGRLACAVCHQEHRGPQHDLKQISERRCQICHVKPFHAFSQDHPEFTNYPYQRRMRIHFDHSTHYGLHFGNFQRLMPDGRKPESCTTCHAPDPSGAKMLVRGFEQSCASCHAREIQIENALPGVPFVTLPALDEAALKWKIAPWPRTVASGSLPDRAGPIDQLSPFMLLLLSSDAEFRKAQRTLKGVNLTRLQTATPAQQQAVVKYAAAIRGLFRELADGGETGLRRRLEAALDGPLDREMRGAVVSPRSTGSLLIDAMRTADDLWFRPKNGKTDKDQPPASNGSRRRFGNWRIRDDDFSIRYRPRLHADPFLRFWLDRGAAAFAQSDVDARSVRVAGRPLRERALGRMFRQLTDPAVPGSCVKCHTVDRTWPKLPASVPIRLTRKLAASATSNGKLQINWIGYRPAPYTHGFTRFSHHPHVKELGTGEAACATCHVRNGEVKLFHRQFTRRDWLPNFDAASALTSGFAAMRRQDCAKCHTPTIAGESCLHCHNYHVGRFPPRE
jgi:Doubled CXXCH motif (Paired_CXXCH_1)